MRIAEEYCAHLTDSGTTPPVLRMQRKILSANDDMEAMFSLQEPQVALTTPNLGSSPGPDGATYSALKHLSTKT